MAVDPIKIQTVLRKASDQQLMALLKRPDSIPSMFVQQEIRRRNMARQAAKADMSKMAMAQRPQLTPEMSRMDQPPTPSPQDPMASAIPMNKGGSGELAKQKQLLMQMYNAGRLNIVQGVAQNDQGELGEFARGLISANQMRPTDNKGLNISRKPQFTDFDMTNPRNNFPGSRLNYSIAPMIKESTANNDGVSASVKSEFMEQLENAGIKAINETTPMDLENEFIEGQFDPEGKFDYGVEQGYKPFMPNVAGRESIYIDTPLNTFPFRERKDMGASRGYDGVEVMEGATDDSLFTNKNQRFTPEMMNLAAENQRAMKKNTSDAENVDPRMRTNTIGFDPRTNIGEMRFPPNYAPKESLSNVVEAMSSDKAVPSSEEDFFGVNPNMVIKKPEMNFATTLAEDLGMNAAQSASPFISKGGIRNMDNFAELQNFKEFSQSDNSQAELEAKLNKGMESTFREDLGKVGEGILKGGTLAKDFVVENLINDPRFRKYTDLANTIYEDTGIKNVVDIVGPEVAKEYDRVLPQIIQGGENIKNFGEGILANVNPQFRDRTPTLAKVELGNEDLKNLIIPPLLTETELKEISASANVSPEVVINKSNENNNKETNNETEIKKNNETEIKKNEEIVDSMNNTDATKPFNYGIPQKNQDDYENASASDKAIYNNKAKAKKMANTGGIGNSALTQYSNLTNAQNKLIEAMKPNGGDRFWQLVAEFGANLAASDSPNFMQAAGQAMQQTLAEAKDMKKEDRQMLIDQAKVAVDLEFKRAELGLQLARINASAAKSGTNSVGYLNLLERIRGNDQRAKFNVAKLISDEVDNFTRIYDERKGPGADPTERTQAIQNETARITQKYKDMFPNVNLPSGSNTGGGGGITVNPEDPLGI